MRKTSTNQVITDSLWPSGWRSVIGQRPLPVILAQGAADTPGFNIGFQRGWRPA